MADFATLVRKGVALADRLVGSLEVDVTITNYSQTAQEADGAPIEESETTVGGIVEDGSKRVRLTDGQETIVETTVFLPKAVTVYENSKLTVDGRVLGPIVNISGLRDPVGGRYYTEIACGVSTDRV